MKFYKYLTIILSIIVMNFAFAELRTWGMPTDTQEQESPNEETSPEEGAPEEGAPEEGMPEEGIPEDDMPEDDMPQEGAPEEGDDMPTETDDSEINEDQPVKFKEEYKISASLALPIYTGSNLEYRFDNGIGFNFGLTTPFTFNLMNKDINLSAFFAMNSLTANDESSSQGTSDYSPMLIGLNLNTDLSILDFSFGTGLSMASGDVVSNEDYSMTTLFMSLGLGYTFPFEKFDFVPEQFKGMSLSVGSNLVMIMGAPDDTGDSSNLINLGMSLGYPIFF